MSSSSNQAENGHKYFFLLDFTFAFHAGTWYSPPASTSRDKPNAKNSYLYSRLMFLQSNAEHIPSFEGGGEKKVGERKEEGDDIKDRLIFCAICWLVLSLPSHYIMSEIVNKQITTAHQRARRGSSTPSFSGGLSGKKHLFLLSILIIYPIFICTAKKKKMGKKRVTRGFIWTIVSELAKYLWHMSFTGCRGAITVIYGQTSHHGTSFSKWYTAIHQWMPTCAIFLSNRGRVTSWTCRGGLLLITRTSFDGCIHVKQSNLLPETHTWRCCPRIFAPRKVHFDHRHRWFIIFHPASQKTELSMVFCVMESGTTHCTLLLS